MMDFYISIGIILVMLFVVLPANVAQWRRILERNAARRKAARTRAYNIDTSLDPYAFMNYAITIDTSDRMGFRRDLRFITEKYGGESWMDQEHPEIEQALTPAPPTEAGTAATSGGSGVFFDADEPTTFDDFGGQHHITASLEAMIQGLPEDQCALPPQLFLGPPGLGKTLVAKISTHELGLRNLEHGYPYPDFIEVMPADVADIAQLDAVVRRAQRTKGSVLFLDEIHELKGAHIYNLYRLLAEKRYKFATEAEPVYLPDVTVFGATTDAGALAPAFLRRFEQWNFMPATRDELTRYVMARSFPIAPDACERIINGTHFGGAPWEALKLRSLAEMFARARKADAIALADVERVIAVHGIDELGLRTIDRNVLEAIYTQPRYRNGARGKGQEFVCYGQSEQAICQLASVDRAQYKEQIKPRLLSRRLIEVRAGYGQALTQRGIAHVVAHGGAHGGAHGRS